MTGSSSCNGSPSKFKLNSTDHDDGEGEVSGYSSPSLSMPGMAKTNDKDGGPSLVYRNGNPGRVTYSNLDGNDDGTTSRPNHGPGRRKRDRYAMGILGSDPSRNVSSGDSGVMTTRNSTMMPRWRPRHGQRQRQQQQQQQLQHQPRSQSLPRQRERRKKKGLSIFAATLLVCVCGLTSLAMLVLFRLLHGGGGKTYYDYYYNDFLDIESFTPSFGGGDYFALLSNDQRMKISFDKRARERRKRTRPPPPPTSASPLQPFHFMARGGRSGKWTGEYILPTSLRYQNTKKNKKVVHDPNTPDDSSTISISKDLCGVHAQRASKRHSSFYHQRDVLNKTSRVVITSVLSNPIGFNLALALYEKCGVKHIIGIDSILPNTQQHRMEMMDRYAILKKSIPHFSRITVPFDGIHPHSMTSAEILRKEEFDLVKRFQPSHVVHLASFYDGLHDFLPDWSDSMGMSAGDDETQCPPFQLLRHSMVSMEQILNSLKRAPDKANRPHFVYATSMESGDGVDGITGDTLYGTVKFIDELLVSTYHTLYGVESVGLKLPIVYGPWSKKGSIMHDMAERAVQNLTVDIFGGVTRRNGMNINEKLNIAYVDDVVDAIIASMQYRQVESPMIFSVSAKEETTLLSMAKEMERHFPRLKERMASSSSVIFPNDEKLASQSLRATLHRGISRQVIQRTEDQIGWKASTSLNDGVFKLLRWHYGQSFPYGPPIQGEIPHEPDGIFRDYKSHNAPPRHNLPPSLPCASGCGHPDLCTPSIYDGVIEISQNVTKNAGCKYVLYIVNLWQEEDKIRRRSDPSEHAILEQRVCKLAFVSMRSELVHSTVSGALSPKLKVDQISDMKDSEFAKLYGHLNGRIEHNGWTLIWVPGDAATMSEADYSLAKLSPTRFFADNVSHAMYVNPERTHPGSTETVLKLMKFINAGGKKAKRTRYYVDKVARKWIDIPEEPAKRAVLFLSKMKFSNDVTPESPVQHVIRMMVERDEHEYTTGIRAQQDFYGHAVHLVRSAELRPAHARGSAGKYFPWRWVRTSFLVHELKLEESRQLRCDWYREHIFWDNSGMEDLSFAYMAGKRRVLYQLGPPEEDGWNALMMKPTSWVASDPDITDTDTDTDEEGGDDGITVAPHHNHQARITDGKGAELFIRIMDSSAKANERDSNGETKGGEESSSTRKGNKGREHQEGGDNEQDENESDEEEDGEEVEESSARKKEGRW